MPDELAERRRFYAEEVEAICDLRTKALVEALATVPREAFLPAGPWVIRSEGDIGRPSRRTPDADPRHLYHNVSVAIDPARDLFNGAPGVAALFIDALDLKPGERVFHVGCGLGYYSAILAHCVGPAGRVVAVEIDPALAAGARERLAAVGNVDVVRGDGTDTRGETFDAILVSAGVTHPLDRWLDALAPGGRLVFPLTCSVGPKLGKGFILLVTRAGHARAMTARVLTMVAIYSAEAIRDATMNEQLAQALRRAPWPSIAALRRDPHDPSPACWLHGETFCLNSASPFDTRRDPPGTPAGFGSDLELAATYQP